MPKFPSFLKLNNIPHVHMPHAVSSSEDGQLACFNILAINVDRAAVSIEMLFIYLDLVSPGWS